LVGIAFEGTATFRVGDDDNGTMVRRVSWTLEALEAPEVIGSGQVVGHWWQRVAATSVAVGLIIYSSMNVEVRFKHRTNDQRDISNAR
jgi:hypothetical protein